MKRNSVWVEGARTIVTPKTHVVSPTAAHLLAVTSERRRLAATDFAAIAYVGRCTKCLITRNPSEVGQFAENRTKIIDHKLRPCWTLC